MVARSFERTDKLVQLQVHRFGVTILRVLNQKHHQEGHDGGGGVNDELPRIGKMKRRTSHDPNKNDQYGPAKCPGTAEHDR